MSPSTRVSCGSGSRPARSCPAATFLARARPYGRLDWFDGALAGRGTTALRNRGGRSEGARVARTEIERLGLGRLERLDLKSFWGEQLPDLTPWFLQNIDLLGETLGLDITPLEREVNVDTGAFKVLGTDATGRPIVIENRLEATDHNQLGQMIVHASGLDAAVVIWVAPRFHEEFRRGLDWLNDRTDSKVDFFGVEIGLVRIGRSLPAPVLDVVVQPRNWRKSGRRQVRLPVGTPLFPGPPAPSPQPRHAAEADDGPAPAREPPMPVAPDTPSSEAGEPLIAAPAPPPP